MFSYFVYQKSHSFYRENENFQNNKREETDNYHFLSQMSVQFCCAAYLDRFLTQPWPDLWLNLFHILAFFPFSKYAETTIFIGFSAKTCFAQKIRNTICEHSCASWFFVLFFLHFCFLGFCCVRFFKEWKQTKIEHKTTKKETRPQDANQKTT